MAKTKTGSEDQRAFGEAYARYCAGYVLASMGDTRAMSDRLGEAGADPKLVAPYALGVRDSHEDKGLQAMKDVRQELSARGVTYADAEPGQAAP